MTPPQRRYLAMILLPVTSILTLAAFAGAEVPEISVRVLDVRPGSTGSNPSEPVAWNGQLFFSAQEGCPPTGHGREVFTATISTGPSLLLDINPASTNCDGISGLFHDQAAGMNASLIFRADQPGTGKEPWRTDGSEVGTEILKDIRSFSGDSAPYHFATVLGGAAVAFAADSGGDGEPWITDGTTDGTEELADIVPGGSSAPFGFTDLSSTAFVFFANDGASIQDGLYVSDGSGATFVEAINPTGSSPQVEHLATFDGRGKALFFANDGTTGREPWVTDGTAAGTFLLKDINPGVASSNTSDTSQNDGFVQLGDLMYFMADDGATGAELWVTDGTSAGTQLLTELNPGPNSGYSARATVFQGLLYFAGPGWTIWRSDGTAQGTAEWLSLGSPGAREFEAAGQVLYFTSSTDLWASDGTLAGTGVVASFADGVPVRAPYGLTTIDPTLGLIAFVTSTADEGREMVLAHPTIDVVPPPPPTLDLSPNPVLAGNPTLITATASDDGTGGNLIAAIEYQVDGGSWVPLDPLDGAWDEPTETGQGQVVLSQGGAFDVCVRAEDDRGNVSGLTCEVLEAVADLRVRAIEVNQVIQNWRNEVTLYKEKETLVRVFLEEVDANSPSTANGRLRVSRGGQPLPGSPLESASSMVVPSDAAAVTIVSPTEVDSVRGDLSQSLQFLIPREWTDVAGPTDLEIEFELSEPMGGTLECAEPDGDADCSVAVTFVPWSLRHFDFFSIAYRQNHEFALNVIATGGTYRLTSGPDDSDPIAFDASAEEVEDAVKNLLNTGLNGKRVSVLCTGCGGSGTRNYEIVVLRGQPETLGLDPTGLIGNGGTTLTTRQVGGGMIKPSIPEMREQMRRVNDIFPVKRIGYRIRDLGSYSRAPNLGTNVNLDLQVIRRFDTLRPRFELYDRSFGVLLEGGPGGGGVASGRVASWYTSGSEGDLGNGYARNRGAHEAAHTFGQHHAVTEDHSGLRRIGICGAKAYDTDSYHPFVFDTGITNSEAEDPPSTTWPTIGPLGAGPDDEIWGASPRVYANGQPDDLVVTDPRFSAALMSYCSPSGGQGRWMSANVYQSLASRVRLGGASSAQSTGGGTGTYAIVTGAVDAETGEATIRDVVTVQGSDPGYDAGDVHVAILDEHDAEIAALDVMLFEAGQPDNPDADSEPSIFIAPIPIPGGAQPKAATVDIDGAEVARVDASLQPPTITIDSPHSATVVGGTIPVAWTANDLDGDDLTATVSLSLDDGITWETLGHRIEGSSYDHPTRFLAGSTQARIEVLVTDGFHTTAATSDAFVIEPGVPLVFIDVPRRGAEVPANGLLSLRGSGWDPEDGPDVSLEWILDIDGPIPVSLGLEPEVDYPTDQLSLGCHTVTLVATDTQANSTSEHVVVDVGATGCLVGRIFEDGFESGDTGAW